MTLVGDEWPLTTLMSSSVISSAAASNWITADWPGSFLAVRSPSQLRQAERRDGHRQKPEHWSADGSGIEFDDARHDLHE